MLKIPFFVLLISAFMLQAADSKKCPIDSFDQFYMQYLKSDLSIEKFEQKLSKLSEKDLSDPGPSEKTPLMRACMDMNPDLVKILLKFKADPTVVSNGEDLLTHVFKQAYINSINTCRILYGKVLDILKDSMGISSEDEALSHAVKHGMKFTKDERETVLMQSLCFRFAGPQDGRDYRMLFRSFSSFDANCQHNMNKAAKRN